MTCSISQPEAPPESVRNKSERSPSGSSPGPGGCSCEMLRVLLDDREGLLLLTAAAEHFARGDVPHCIFSAFALATLTALQQRRGGVRASPRAHRSDGWSPKRWPARGAGSGPRPDATGETLFAFLDDVYFVVKPDRVGDVCQVVEQTFSDQNPHGQDSSAEFSRSWTGSV